MCRQERVCERKREIERKYDKLNIERLREKESLYVEKEKRFRK
jgi:hypothetical protein